MATLPTPSELTAAGLTAAQMKALLSAWAQHNADLLGTDSANKAAARSALGVISATATAQGLVELATAAEVQAGTDNTRAVTPAGLASRTATEGRAGIVELATSAEAQALTSAVVALTPARLADAFKGANQSLAGNGYQKLPGGLIIQWGVVSIPTGSNEGTATATFPIAFPNQALRAYATLIHAGASSSWFGFTTWPSSLSATQVTVALNTGSTTRTEVGTVAYLAIGH